MTTLEPTTTTNTTEVTEGVDVNATHLTGEAESTTSPEGNSNTTVRGSGIASTSTETPRSARRSNRSAADQGPESFIQGN